MGGKGEREVGQDNGNRSVLPITASRSRVSPFALFTYSPVSPFPRFLTARLLLGKIGACP